MDEDYSNFWIPFTIIYIPVFFVMRPLIKSWGISPRSQDGMLWVLVPFSIGIPTAFSQQFIKYTNHEVISINNPKEVHLYPKEQFFKIKSFYVNRNDFTLYKERHVSGGRSKSLKVNNYYIAPMYSDDERQSTGIAYGIRFSTSLNHGLLFRKDQPKKLGEFNIKSASEFTFYHLDSVQYFEKQIDSEEANNFAKAWSQNNLLDPKAKPIVLVGTNETFKKHLERGRNMSIYSILISLTVAICLLWIIEYYRT